MRVIVTGRQMGKTHRITQAMIEDPDSICLVHSLDAASVVQELAMREFSEKLNNNRFLTPRNRPRTMSPQYLYQIMHVDNADLILSGMFHQPLGLVTMTGILESMSGAPELDEILTIDKGDQG